MKTWINVSPDSDFSIHNIPFGIVSYRGKAFAATRIGNTVINLPLLAEKGYLSGITGFNPETLTQPVLNNFIALGKQTTSAVRKRIIEIFEAQNQQSGAELSNIKDLLLDAALVQMQMPVHVPNYTDFYSSREHATNVGIMFRGKENALMPNWLHLPVGYHGRASSITVSGTPLHRPLGQSKKDEDPLPVFGPSRLVDFELEMAFVLGKSNPLGSPIPVNEAEDYIFGMLLFNDWSARDLQKWEYVPLGPFLGKNFFSSVSPWIVTLDALEPFRCAGPVQEPEVLPYLQSKGNHNFDIALDVIIQPEGGEESVVSHSNFKYLYWNICQQLAHHTINGCNMQVGDLCASGTISGPEPGSYGSMLELSWSGKNPVLLSNGAERRFIADGDTVIIRGYSEKNGIRVGFGEVSNQLLPARV